MHELAAQALTLAHPTLRCGVPHFREKRYIPIRTSAHLIVFDPEKISPLYTMLEAQPTDETVIEREDNFTSGDISLPDELCTTEKHYANWNKAHPEFPVDKGHSAGSQYRRGDVVEQSDIDTLAGVTPEASKTNRNVKGPLESAILAHAVGGDPARAEALFRDLLDRDPQDQAARRNLDHLLRTTSRPPETPRSPTP